MSKSIKKSVIIGFIVFCVAIFAIVVALNIRSGMESERLLEESIKSQMLSIANAAKRIVGTDKIASYNDIGDILADPTYEDALSSLRELAKDTGASYIYVLKEVDGKYYFVFDTDEEDEGIFVEYELSPVHEHAFAGNPSAGVMNVIDEYGSFNTAAVPIRDGREVVGIAAADTQDVYVDQSRTQFRINITLLVIVLAVVLVIGCVVIFRLLRRLEKVQAELEKLAHYDKLTDLPNRRYLMDHLAEITGEGKDDPFALLFIDLDNFKAVNDNAGHDAGDALLQHVGMYLQTAQGSASGVFRTGSGSLNMAARVGGDEFVLLAPGIGDAAAALAFAQKLAENFQSREIDKNMFWYEVGMSIGVSLYPLHTRNFQKLIKYADIAMYKTKRAGKNGCRVYDKEMGEKQED